MRPPLFSGLCVTLLLGSCASWLESDAGEVIAGACKNEDSDPDVDVSFMAQIQPKLHMGCTCHSPLPAAMGAAPTGSAIDGTGFSVGDYASLRRGGQQSRDKIIVPGDPCASLILQKLSDSPPFGARMPVFGPYWSRVDIALIHDWIAEGAHAD